MVLLAKKNGWLKPRIESKDDVVHEMVNAEMVAAPLPRLRLTPWIEKQTQMLGKTSCLAEISCLCQKVASGRGFRGIIMIN